MYAEIQIQCIRTFLIINVLLSQTNNKSHIIGIFILVNKNKQLQVYKNKTLISRMPTPSIKHHVTSSIFHR